MTDLTAALDTIRPVLADRYANQVRRAFAVMVEVHGADLRGIHNSWDFARTYRGLVASVLTWTGHGAHSTCAIDETKLAKVAAAYAEAAVAQWKDKIEGKLGDLTEVNVVRMAGACFGIKGSRAGRNVWIEQDVIMKSSTKGLLFNQFPARIYVDGKFTSEAKYKAAFA